MQLFFDDQEAVRLLFGAQNATLKFISRELEVSTGFRGNQLTLNGADYQVELARSVLEQLYQLIRDGYPVYDADVSYALRILRDNPKARLRDIFLDQVYLTGKKQIISPKSKVQKDYLQAMRAHDLVFGVGPAGTGKTYLAMAKAVDSLLKNEYERIILARPAVEAGEKLGFLPGDLAEKVNPYLRPLYDALHDMMDFEKYTRLLHKGVIEVAPLAFMRGRTLNNAFIILDEAQNTTSEQMKMFLTRLGHRSRAVVTGDITQVDLPGGINSGLIEAMRLLEGIDGIAFVRFSRQDVVRHKLVRDIIRAYEGAGE
ncbi:MAG: PhoH family protein [Desulfarculales bacterium]|nr:PhoH family protein [Desulfarculales bacterium]